MRRYPLDRMLAVAIAAGLTLAGCSSGQKGEQPSSPTTSPQAAAPQTTPQTRTAEPGKQEVSPGGVTTAVGAPAESTEEEYFQACHAAKTWIDQKGGDPQSQIEPYLGELQRSDSVGPGTFGTPWSKLTPGRQAAVIVAVEAAAAQQCS
jgi:Putative lipoprotein LpqV